MQREDVDRMDWKAAWYALDADARALLDRAEKAEAERDALQGQLNDLRNGWAKSVKAHAALLAERDAAFAAGQESMRERSLAEIALMREDCHPPRTPLVAAVPIWLDVAAHRIRQLPIKPCPE